MTKEEADILLDPRVIQIIEKNLDQDPAAFALNAKYKNFPIPVLSSRIKYLQKARTKLPSYFKSRCLIPSRAFEQASSERTAFMKRYSGTRLLDLTCGLGVDAFAFSHSFDHVWTLEPDTDLAYISKQNFSTLGRDNITLVNQSAEDFLSQYDGPAFDMIFADPDRRAPDGRRVFRFEDCKPDVLALMPLLQQHTLNLVIKGSPLYELKEAPKEFPCVKELSVVSVDNECREILIHCYFSQTSSQLPSPPIISHNLYRKGKEVRYRFELTDSHELASAASAFVLPETPFYLCEPDVAFYKTRKVPELFKHEFQIPEGRLNHPDGYFFAPHKYPGEFPGRVFRIQEVIPFKPKILKKRFKGQRFNLSRRHFPDSVKAIRQATGILEGGNQFLLFTQIDGSKFAFLGDMLPFDDQG